MLSDEEKELVEKIQNRNKIGIYELIRTFKREGIENFITVRRKYIDIMINLIEKQSKEIEELEEENNTTIVLEANRRNYNRVYNLGKIYTNKKWENKIKAKIEELDKEEKENLKGTKGQDRYAIKQEYMYKRSVLQSLLEKE